MDGLIIKEKWLRLILSGLKSWEIRGSRTNKRGTIYLIQSGSSHIMGQVDIVDCIELTKERYEENRGKHCIGAGWESLPYSVPYAWVLENYVQYQKPIPYNHPQGAVIWVKGIAREREIKQNELQTMEKEI